VSFFLEAMELPVVHVNVWSGMSLENKKKVVEGVTRVLEEIGIPREAVTAIICEEPKENWASGGKLHSERFANRGPQP
jgi:4-oxalocrotonate tautomerase